jgi:hypothetical protein
MPEIHVRGKPLIWYVGVDPGASGGMVAVSINNEAVLFHAIGNSTDQGIWEWFDNLGGKAYAVIEKVGGYIGQAQPASAAFNFGRSAGFLHGCLVAAGIPYEETPPRRWQKALGIPQRQKHTRTAMVEVTKGRRKGELQEKRVGGETPWQWKTRLLQEAQRLLPRCRITKATADAALMAIYCRRKMLGQAI